MRPKKYPYSGSQKTDNKQDRVEGKIIKWIKSKRYMGGKAWSKRT